MIIDHEKRFVFVHVQKTAGLTANSHLLAQCPTASEVWGLTGDRHARLKQALQAHPECRDYFVFGFVRNPWARLFSWYSMVERRWDLVARSGRDDVAAAVRSNPFWRGVREECPDFESFVMRGPDIFSRLRRPQIDYLRYRGRVADFIGRTESFDDDFREVCRTLGIQEPQQVPRHNRGPTRDYREHYTAAMVDRVADLFAPDIERWGYSF